MIDNQWSLVFWATLTGTISCLATGLGAIPVHFVQNHSKFMRALSQSFAAGMMISASVFSLASEGIALKDKIPLAPYSVIAGLILGALFFWWTEKLVTSLHLEKHHMAQGYSKKGILLFIAMFIHSIPEGIAIGVGFATGSLQFGLIMAIAIAVHNIPEGIAVSLPLKRDGKSTLQCAWASILTSFPQVIFPAPAALLAWVFEPILPLGLGFAGGAMIYLVISEMLPESLEDGGKVLTSFGVMIGLCTMLLITNLISLIH